MEPLHNKVKVPAIVGTVISIALGVAAVVGANVPEAVPAITFATTLINAIAGYFTYS